MSLSGYRTRCRLGQTGRGTTQAVSPIRDRAAVECTRGVAGAHGEGRGIAMGRHLRRRYLPPLQAPETYSSQVSVGRTGLLGDKHQYLKDCAVNSTGNNTLGDPDGVLVVDETGSPGADGLLQ